MLRIEDLSKRYGDHLVFARWSFALAPGCHALCEQESTGKSTLLNIVAGAASPDSGDVFIDGHSIVHAPEQARVRLAFVPADTSTCAEQTGRDLLARQAASKGVPVDDSVLAVAERLGASAHLDKRFEQMSTGTRRKMFLAAAALGAPAVVVADGPSDGLDRQARLALAELFNEWALTRVVLFASHDDELVQACRARRFSVGEAINA